MREHSAERALTIQDG
jgi:hypothetical protein